MPITHPPRYRQLAGYGLLVLAGTAVAVLAAVHGVHALDAAGLTTTKGSVAGIAKFANNLTDNVKWLVATMIGLALAVVGLLFMSGHTRAHDIAIKAGVGAGIIVGLGGIVK